MNYEKIATAAGYSIWKMADGKFTWYHLDDSSSAVSFDTQKEAWKDCCQVNVLSKDCYEN